VIEDQSVKIDTSFAWIDSLIIVIQNY